MNIKKIIVSRDDENADLALVAYAVKQATTVGRGIAARTSITQQGAVVSGPGVMFVSSRFEPEVELLDAGYLSEGDNAVLDNAVRKWVENGASRAIKLVLEGTAWTVTTVSHPPRLDDLA